LSNENHMDAKIYDVKGKEAGTFALPEAVFGQKWNANLVHEVVVSMQSNARAGTAHTKFRGEVAGGGKKPWKQKGTGRARHGSSRSPIWVGGGVAHGPRTEKSYAKKINKNVRGKALAVALSKKNADGMVVFVDSLGLTKPSAKQARAAIDALGSVAKDLPIKRKNAALIVLSGRDQNAEKSFQNFGNVEVVQARDVNPVEVLTYKYVIVADAQASVEVLKSRVASKAAATKMTAKPENNKK
jgi:large subunit ribosomal protein L4